MRWFRILFAVALLGISGCSSTTLPQIPSEEDEGGKKDKDTQGFVLPDIQIFYG